MKITKKKNTNKPVQKKPTQEQIERVNKKQEDFIKWTEIVIEKNEVIAEKEEVAEKKYIFVKNVKHNGLRYNMGDELKEANGNFRDLVQFTKIV